MGSLDLGPSRRGKNPCGRHGRNCCTMEPPDSFLCPLTLSIFVDPVICSDGHTYERRAIEDWLKTKLVSPATNEKLKDATLLPNITLRKAIEEWKCLQESGDTKNSIDRSLDESPTNIGSNPLQSVRFLAEVSVG